MGATDAERARRYRRHRAGDHSLCLPGRCDALEASTGAVTAPNDVTVVTNTGEERDVTPYGPRGQQLWGELTAGQTPDPARRVLIEEACRLADRLDKLDALLTGSSDAWLRFQVDESGTEVTVLIDKPLAEARQQQMTLRAIVAELRQGKVEAPSQGGGILDQLAARRAARIAGAAGQ